MSEVIAKNEHATMAVFNAEDILNEARRMAAILEEGGKVYFAPEDCIGLVAAALLALRGPLGCPSEYVLAMAKTILEIIDAQQRIKTADVVRAPHIKALIQ